MNPLVDTCAQAGKEIQNKEKVNLPSCIGQRTIDSHHVVSDQKMIRIYATKLSFQSLPPLLKNVIISIFHMKIGTRYLERQ